MSRARIVLIGVGIVVAFTVALALSAAFLADRHDRRAFARVAAPAEPEPGPPPRVVVSAPPPHRPPPIAWRSSRSKRPPVPATARAHPAPAAPAPVREPTRLDRAGSVFAGGGFGGGVESIDVTGAYGTVCDPRTGEPTAGLVVVMQDSDGREAESPVSAPDGHYAMALEPGARYRPVAVVLPDGTRTSVQGDELGVRVWEGRNVRIDVCSPVERPDAAAPPEQATSRGPTGFYGTVHDPHTGRPAAGLKVVFRAPDGREIEGFPSGPEGYYTFAIPPGERWAPVGVVDRDGTRFDLDSGGAGFRLEPGETQRVDFLRFRSPG